jgi:hypothetical protein
MGRRLLGRDNGGMKTTYNISLIRTVKWNPSVSWLYTNKIYLKKIQNPIQKITKAKMDESEAHVI